MEEQVNIQGGRVVGDLMGEVAAVQRQTLAHMNVLGQLRLRPPARRRSLATRWLEKMPRLRFVVPTLAAVATVALWWAAQSAPLTFAVSRSGEGASIAGEAGQLVQAPADGPVPLQFSDGSQVTLERGARIRVASLDRRGATLQIERGRAEVSVRHRSQTHWSLRAGSFEVVVTGTRFSIEWEDRSQALTVVMSEGTVEIAGSHLVGGSPIVVAAGQKFHATAREPRWTLAAAGAPTAQAEVMPTRATPEVESVPGPTAPSLSPAEATAPPAASSARAGGSSSAPRAWQVLARAGRYNEALKLVERSGFERACARLGAEDLVQLGDAARLARNAPRAEQAYRMARKRFPSADRPAFAMGLVAFEQRRDFRGAARWFDLYARKYPNGPLANEAVGREMESWHRAGDTSRARRAARAYLDQAPSGPYAPLARQIAAP